MTFWTLLYCFLYINFYVYSTIVPNLVNQHMTFMYNFNSIIFTTFGASTEYQSAFCIQKTIVIHHRCIGGAFVSKLIMLIHFVAQMFHFPLSYHCSGKHYCYWIYYSWLQEWFIVWLTFGTNICRWTRPIADGSKHCTHWRIFLQSKLNHTINIIVVYHFPMILFLYPFCCSSSGSSTSVGEMPPTITWGV